MRCLTSPRTASRNRLTLSPIGLSDNRANAVELCLFPWAQAVNEDGTLRSADELKAIYEPKGVTPEHKVITYCRIGERSSHTWFVLKYLLGYPDVRNYDGSWTEGGNLVRTRSEKA